MASQTIVNSAVSSQQSVVSTLQSKVRIQQCAIGTLDNPIGVATGHRRPPLQPTTDNRQPTNCPYILQSCPCFQLAASTRVGVARETLRGEETKMLLILIIILLLLTVGSFPAWPYSRGWGYYPSGGLGLVVIILVLLLLMGRI